MTKQTYSRWMSHRINLWKSLHFSGNPLLSLPRCHGSAVLLSGIISVDGAKHVKGVKNTFLSTSILAILSFGWWLNVFSVLSFTVSILLQDELFAYTSHFLSHTLASSTWPEDSTHSPFTWWPFVASSLSFSLHQHTSLFLCFPINLSVLSPL